MNQVKISDITMKQVTKAFTLSFKEKIELAKLLDKLGVSVIELEGIRNPRIDALRIKSVASAVRDSIVAAPVELSQAGVDAVWAALREARHPRLQVCAPFSSVQMEYLSHKKPDAMLKAVTETIAACREKCADVEFVADDATRSDPALLQQAIEAAIDAGATTITVCDTAGTMLPEEFSQFIANLRTQIPQLDAVTLGVSCCDNLAMADACTVAAICQGAGEVKTAAYPDSSASLTNVSRILAARGDSFDATCPIRVTQLSRIIGQITWMCQTSQTKSSPLDNIMQDGSDIMLSAQEDISAVLKVAAQLGYDLSEEDGVKVFEAFQVIAAKKEQVSAKELDAIVASAAMQVPPTYVLDTYVITAGNTFSSTAHLKMAKGTDMLEGVCVGDGPIDAAFRAIEQITGRHYELDDFQIQAVTEGREAMGQTVVKLHWDGKLYSGRGISTDIVGASIQAYLSALNKIVYEEEEV